MKWLTSVAILLMALVARTTAAQEITINFDALPPGELQADGLAAFGVESISASGVPGAGPSAVRDTTVYPNAVPASGSRFVEQLWNRHDTGLSHVVSMRFSKPLSAMRFTRIGQKNGGSTPRWTARFYSQEGRLLGSVGEDQWRMSFSTSGMEWSEPMPDETCKEQDFDATVLRRCTRNPPAAKP